MYDSVAELRRSLPVVEVTKPYVFTTVGSDGQPETVTLDGLFGTHPQLVVYHFMFDPSASAGCPSCSLIGDHIPPLPHLASRGTAFTAVSRAPADKIEAYKKRMGWAFPWVSSHGGDFNYDFHVSNPRFSDADAPPAVRDLEWSYNFKTPEQMRSPALAFLQSVTESPGHSVFVRGGARDEGGVGFGEKGKVYHAYSCYARGIERPIGTFTWLDMTPLGRQDKKGQNGLGFKRRDEYTEEDLTG